MIGTAQGAQGRLRASRGWLAALALSVAFGFGISPVLAGPEAEAPGIAKKDAFAKASAAIDDKAKKDETLEKADLSVKAAADEKAKKDEAFEKDVVSHKAGGVEGIKDPETKTGDERKKP